MVSFFPLHSTASNGLLIATDNQETTMDGSKADSGTPVASALRFKEMRDTLESQSNSGMVMDLNEFYKKQRAKKQGENRKKGEATQNLRNFRNAYTPPKRDKLKRQSSLRQAADRAAAAMFLSGPEDSTSSPKSRLSIFSDSIDSSSLQKPSEGWKDVKMTNKKKKNKSSPGIMTSMGEFYRIQKRKRRLDKQQKKETEKERVFHSYQGSTAATPQHFSSPTTTKKVIKPTMEVKQAVPMEMEATPMESKQPEEQPKEQPEESPMLTKRTAEPDDDAAAKPASPKRKISSGPRPPPPPPPPSEDVPFDEIQSADEPQPEPLRAPQPPEASIPKEETPFDESATALESEDTPASEETPAAEETPEAEETPIEMEEYQQEELGEVLEIPLKGGDEPSAEGVTTDSETESEDETIGEPVPLIENPTVAVDYKSKDYRAFIFVREYQAREWFACRV